jgi:cell division GTPase FtsZ
LTVGVVTKPFEFEGKRRMDNAESGLAELEANVDSLIVVLNEKLLDVLGDDATQDEAFAHANDVLKNAVGGIAEIINVPGLMNVDFEDVRTVMGEPGKAMMGTAIAAGPDRARIAAEQAVACPLLEGIDLSGAKGVLVLITAAKGSLKLSESKLAMNTIRAYASPDAHVIYGTAYDDELGDDVTQDEAFAHANDVLKNAVGGIAEIINEYGNVNVDFEDVRTVMGEPGKAMMGTAVAAGPDRARIAAEQAVACPLLEGIDLSGAKGVLVLVTAAKGSLKLSESKLAMNTIRAYASSEAHVIYGAAYDDSLGDEMRVTVVATGLSRQGVRRTAPPLQVLRTGTDNVPFNVPTVNTAVGGPGATQPDYNSMAVPSVWRTNRTQAAAKVDALASGGMDDFEIPAFLRKQAD